MKKSILIIVIAIAFQSFSQIDVKNIENVPMANPIEIIDIPGPSALGGDEVLWSEDFADETTPNIITEDIAGYGDWKWSDQSPGGQWSENAEVIQAKSHVSFRSGFKEISRSCFVANTPGPTPIDLKQLDYINRPIPLHPFEIIS